MPSLLEALEQKYGESSTESEGSEEEEGISVAIFVPRKPPRMLVPSLLVLNDCDIASAGDRQALVDKCAAVEELDLAKNKLQRWPEVFGILKQMPRLKFVNLSFNQLSSPLHEVELTEDLKWQNLRNLVMNSTQVPWENVQQILDHLPSLEELHLSLNEYNHVDLCSCNCQCKTQNEDLEGCRLWETHEYTEHERRQLLIARLPNVETLNGGGRIEPDEREDAERAFIRYYMDKPESDRPERYFELVSIHGKLDPLVNVDLRPEKRVKVTFTCGNNSEVRSVDVYRTVSDLKTKLEAFAGFSATSMRLFYVDQDLRDQQGPEEMRYPHKQLYSYNISSGDEIIIDYKQKSRREKV